MKRFNLRVYGIIINEKKELLVSDERRFGKSFTKFPGGGLEWGEGIEAGLQREIQEEIGLDADIGALFYVNEFFQESAFRKEDQLVSFYYKIDQIDFEAINVSNHEIPLIEEGEKFRWLPLSQISEATFTFPIDKIVAKRLKQSL